MNPILKSEAKEFSKGIHESGLENFLRRNPNFDPTKDKLLNLRHAQRWYSQLINAVRAGTYTFQKVFETKSGPQAYIEGNPVKVFSSYDYLGLIGHPEIENATIKSIRKFGTSTGGVRLLTGTCSLHEQLEKKISAFKGTESALAFSSGYLANLAAITSLIDPRDLVIADEHIHRSMVDALRLAKIPYVTFPHNNTEILGQLLSRSGSYRRKFVIVEGIYSMEGDICPLKEIVRLKNEWGALLIIDEAHSLGVLGKSGRGVNEHFEIPATEIDLFTGSLSKAIPSNGGFIAGKEEVIHFLKHGGASFMFSSAMTPANAGACLSAFEIIEAEPQRLKKLWQNTRLLHEGLKQLPIPTSTCTTPIIPVITGSNESALGLSSRLFQHNYLVNAVIYPAVPAHMPRLRICCTAAHDPASIQEFLADFNTCLNE